jgi:hypothetical protein
MSSILTPFEWTWFHTLHCLWGWPQWWWLIQKKDFIEIDTLQTYFSLLPLRYLGVYINKLTIFFIIKWHGLQRALKALFFQFCVCFTSKGYQLHCNRHSLHLFQSKPLLLMKVLLSSLFFMVYFPSSFLTCFLWLRQRRGGWVHDFFPFLFLAPMVEGFYFLAWLWVLSYCSEFSPFIGCFGLINFGRVSSITIIVYKKKPYLSNFFQLLK